MARALHRPGNLPAEVTSFVGRRSELAEARRKLAGTRLLTLVGPGGVGKTRLAVRIATDLGRAYGGGVWLAELAELQDSALVGNAVLAALDLRDQAATEPVALLLSYLADKELLLVLDNCEHLLDASAQLVTGILRAAPRVRVVATSREPLNVAGEHVLPVPPLQLPLADAAAPLSEVSRNEAVLLFVERAAAASGRFELTAGNRSAVVDLCRRLDGLPLAIELAAVRTRALTPEQIRHRLGDRFGLLTGGSRAALPRHQTLRTTIEWSYDLLTAAERTLLTRLSVFAGRFTLDDVEAVCCSDDLPAAHALDLLASLFDKSLVVREDADGEACYRLHETMREYARLRLRESGEQADVDRRCVEHYLSRCLRFAAEGRHQLLAWLNWMDREVDNVRAVLRRCADATDPGMGLVLATSLVWFWVTRATTEGVRWLDELLPRDPRPIGHPWAYFVRGFLGVLQNDPGAATPALERSVAAARAAGDPGVLSQALAMASIAANMAGDHASSKRLLAEGRAAADGLDDLGATLMTLQAQALNGFVEGDLAAVTSAAADGVRLSREAGDLYSLGMMLMNQGFAAVTSENLVEAEQRFTEGLQIARRLDDRVAQFHLLGGLACCAAGLRDPRRAAQLFGAAQSLRAEVAADINAGLAPILAGATASVTTALGQSTFRTQFTAGQRLSRDAVSRLALREAAHPAEAVATSAGEGVLGRRETDVARLVAEGLSNKQIGARLFISERTVESHVRNSLDKLGFSSRAQIASWMSKSDHQRSGSGGASEHRGAAPR
jgi:predicted ATPase/DNA-binding CsgD family transcriptional regulator